MTKYYLFLAILIRFMFVTGLFIIIYVEKTTLVMKPHWGKINIDVVSRCDKYNHIVLTT